MRSRQLSRNLCCGESVGEHVAASGTLRPPCLHGWFRRAAQQPCCGRFAATIHLPWYPPSRYLQLHSSQRDWGWAGRGRHSQLCRQRSKGNRSAARSQERERSGPQQSLAGGATRQLIQGTFPEQHPSFCKNRSVQATLFRTFPKQILYIATPEKQHCRKLSIGIFCCKSRVQNTTQLKTYPPQNATFRRIMFRGVDMCCHRRQLDMVRSFLEHLVVWGGASGHPNLSCRSNSFVGGC